MVGMVLKKAAVVLLTILKWMLQAVLMLLKLVLGIAKLFLLLLALVARVVLTMFGVVAGRREGKVPHWYVKCGRAFQKKNVRFPFICLSNSDMWVPPGYKGKQTEIEVQKRITVNGK